MKVEIHISRWNNGRTKFTVERPDHYQGWPVYDQVFICPVCLEHWATVRRELLVTELFPIVFQIAAIPCEHHPHVSNKYMSPIPGSILDNPTFAGEPDWDLMAALPDELLKREFELHVKALEIEDSHEQSFPDYSPSPNPYAGAQPPSGG